METTNERWQLIEDLGSTIDELNCSTEERGNLKTEVGIIEDNLSKYISHLIRGKYQRDCYMKEVADLRPGHAIGVSDYMMKLMFRRLEGVVWQKGCLCSWGDVSVQRGGRRAHIDRIS